MPAAYDSFDYPSYWEGREYEHNSELIALRRLISLIPKIDTLLEIGAGFGRLTPEYLYRAKRIILVDPSSKLLKIARANIKNKKVRFIQSTMDNLTSKIKNNSADVILLIRVLHHIDDVDNAFKLIRRLLVDGGYFILEFPNKSHFKATFSEIFKGNITFPIDIFPREVKSKKIKKANVLPFKNYHPDQIAHKLHINGFSVIKKLSASNVRSSLLKKLLPLDTLIYLENHLQQPLSHINFGPSIFILAKKRA